MVKFTDKNNEPILWMRKKSFLGRKQDVYHIQRNNYAIQDTHYFYTLCMKEIKGMYGEWDITDDPDINDCCKECLKLIKGRNL